MHFLMLIVGAVGAIGAFYWHMQQANKAAQAGYDMAKTVANLSRRLSFLRKSGKAGLFCGFKGNLFDQIDIQVGGNSFALIENLASAWQSPYHCQEPC